MATRKGEQLLAWGGFALGLIGTITGLFAFVEGRRRDRLSSDQQIESLLYEVKDLVGGAYSIDNPIPDTAREQARRKIDAAERLGLGKDNVAVLAARGKLALWNHDTEEAVRLFTRAIKKQNNIAALHELLGIALDHRCRWDDARASYRQAIDLEPTSAASYEDMGNSYLMQGDRASAGEWFERALSLDPDRPTALNGLGRVLRCTEKHDAALDAFQRSVQLEPNPWTNNVVGLMLLSRHQYQAAAESFRVAASRARELKGDDAKIDLWTALFFRGRALRGAGLLAEARDELRRASEVPDLAVGAVALHELREVLIASGQAGEAEAAQAELEALPKGSLEAGQYIVARMQAWNNVDCSSVDGRLLDHPLLICLDAPIKSGRGPHDPASK